MQRIWLVSFGDPDLKRHPYSYDMQKSKILNLESIHNSEPKNLNQLVHSENSFVLLEPIDKKWCLIVLKLITLKEDLTLKGLWYIFWE